MMAINANPVARKSKQILLVVIDVDLYSAPLNGFAIYVKQTSSGSYKHQEFQNAYLRMTVTLLLTSGL
jgi:hypothetical protein